LASIPHWDTRYPRSFLERTLKVHFSGFRCIPVHLRLPNVSRRSANRFYAFRLHNMISSPYASTFLPI
jgi:hypothetical protein